MSILTEISMTISLISCDKPDENKSETQSPISSSSETQTDIKDSSEQDTESEDNEITITLPETVFQDEIDFDPEAYTLENGFKETIVNEDGTISIIMSKEKHEEMILEMKEGIDLLFNELTDSEEMSYISKIESTENYETVTVYVNRGKYEDMILDMTPFIIGLSAMVYQIYIGEEVKITIITKDEQTGDTIDTVIYPDALESFD